MVLSDGEIRKRVSNENLLENYDPEGIKFCGYELSLGKTVKPETGKVVSLDDSGGRRRPIGGNPKCFVIKPSETLIAITKERLNMPTDLCATYRQLNRWANQGLMVLNTSIVEPGYSGQLSCVLVNFSSQRIVLSPGDPVAKLNFQKVEGIPERLYHGHPTEAEYEQLASKMASHLPVSLLDISGVEERVSGKVKGAVQRSITIGGLIIVFLLAWSQMEGFFSEWIYSRTGITTTTEQVQLLLQRQQVDYQTQMQQLKQEIDALKIQEQDSAAKGAQIGARR